MLFGTPCCLPSKCFTLLKFGTKVWAAEVFFCVEELLQVQTRQPHDTRFTNQSSYADPHRSGPEAEVLRI
jgi:hypothetical protein